MKKKKEMKIYLYKAISRRKWKAIFFFWNRDYPIVVHGSRKWKCRKRNADMQANVRQSLSTLVIHFM